MKISIIIPTYNRYETLEKVLESLVNQNYDKKKFEVIVVNDGSIDSTKEIVKKFEKKLKLKYLSQENSGPGVARNRGVEIAKGEIVAFIGDDTILDKNWILEHLKIHKENKNSIVLGLTLWSREIPINDFMKYLAPNGPQFNYGAIKNPKNCTWRFFWTSNISLEKKYLYKIKFDENFRKAGYEDLEIGYRLEKSGLKIIFNKEAVAFHEHYYSHPEEFLKKSQERALDVVYFTKKFPELKRELISMNKIKLWQRMLLLIYSIFPFLKKIKKTKIIYWKLKRRYYFSKGLKNGN